METSNEITFKNLSDGISYFWDLGDDITSTLENPARTFELPGEYRISLTATDEVGCTDSLPKPLKLILNLSFMHQMRLHQMAMG